MDRSTKTCCVLNCENKGSADICLFNFPTDFNLCMLWVQRTGKPEHFEDFAFGGALPFLNRYICSEHFSSVDFVDVKDKPKGLLPGAVPVLNYVELNEVKIKEEVEDIEYGDSHVDISNLGVEIKDEPLDNETNAGNNSCEFTDPLADSFSAESTKEEQLLSDEFFCNYRSAQKRISQKAKRAWQKRVKRNEESDEQKKERNMKNALRAAIRRQNETPEQRERRRINDLLRARRRRSAETEQETRIRRYNDAVRAALRRQNETEEQRAERRMYDSKRAAFRRSQETPEQRALRLKKDRERASRNRLLKKIFQQVHMLENMHEFMPIPGVNPDAALLPNRLDTSTSSDPDLQNSEMATPSPDVPLNISTIGSAVKGCNENTNIDRLQEVLKFLKQNAKTQGDIPPSQLRNAIVNFDSSPLKDTYGSYSAYLAKMSSEASRSNTTENSLETCITHTGSNDNSTATSASQNSDDGDSQNQPESRFVELQQMDTEIEKINTRTEEDCSGEDYVEMPPVAVELHEDGHNAAENSSGKFEDSIMKKAEYCVNLADIPKEIRDHCISDNEQGENWDNSTTATVSGSFQSISQEQSASIVQRTSEEKLQIKESKSIKHVMGDHLSRDYVEMPPVNVESHEDGGNTAKSALESNHERFEGVGAIKDAEYYGVNLVNIPKQIRDTYIGDSEKIANWDNGLVDHESA